MSTEHCNHGSPRIPVMRGGTLHNFVVQEAREVFVLFGFDTAIECPVDLVDGRRNFVDLLATRGRHTIACEVETTPRYVLTNVAKARALGLRLWILTPNRGVMDAVTGKLRRGGGACLAGIRILMLGQLPQAVSESFPTFAPANVRADISRIDRTSSAPPATRRRLPPDTEPLQ